MKNEPDEMNLVVSIKRVKNQCEQICYEWIVSVPDSWSHSGMEMSIETAKDRVKEILTRSVSNWWLLASK